MTPAERANTLVKQLVEKEGEGIVAQSAVGGGLAQRLEATGRRWQTILEIGTLRGLGAIVLAHFAENVISVDVQEDPQRRDVMKWVPRDIRNRIATVVVPDNEAKVILVRHLDFKMAFLDAGHTEGQVAIDFAITNRCGEMLFHDYPASGSGANGVGILLDGIDRGIVERCQPFAWWRASK